MSNICNLEEVISIRSHAKKIVFIAFLPDKEVMNYFRAICESNEFSERALNLTSHALRLNFNNYNVWIYRRKVLRNIKYDPIKELCWIEHVIRENPKTFLAWEHRRAVLKMNLSYSVAEMELNLTESILENDPKSYHAWQHRQWTIQTHKFSNIGLSTAELKFTEKLLEADVRNNSAWNQRFFIVKQRGKIDFILVRREFAYAIEKMKLAFDNESAWNYIRGLLTQFSNLKKLSPYQDFMIFLENEFYEKHRCNRHLVAFLIDAKIEMILEFRGSNEMVQTAKVLQLCNLMADRFDIVRKSYWKFVYRKFCYDKILQRSENNDVGGAKRDETWKSKIGKKFIEDVKLEPTKE